MKKFGLITNKYTVSILILVCLFLADVLLHRGMSRVILPTSFSDKIKAVNLPVCDNQLTAKDKHWISAVDNILLLQKLPENTAGIECNIVFNPLKKSFDIFPDSVNSYSFAADSLLTVYSNKKLHANIWFDIKNLTAENLNASVAEVIRLKNKYTLNNQVVIESSAAYLLRSFCDSGFFTCYQVPELNPYQATEPEIIRFADSLRNSLTKYPASAISCSYVQYPVLKKFFPNYPLLTRADNSSVSIVSYVFKRQLENDEHIKAILYPFKD